MKKKLLLSLCLMAIAVVAFCLWYTRPQTFWQATGMDRDNITGAYVRNEEERSMTYCTSKQ